MPNRTLVRRPRMTGQKRAANRANARQSTGPRTAAGKRRSSLNALKHGLFTEAFAEAMKTFGENPAEFERLHRDFVLSFDPQTPFEAALVEDLARLWWKKRRLDRGENGLQVDEVQSELHKRRRELSDSDAAPIEEGDEAIQQSGLMRVKDCKMKFETAEQHLEMTIAKAERRDPECDVDTLLFLLYGQQPNWRASFIQSLAERLHEAEEQAGDDEAEEPQPDCSTGESTVGSQPMAQPLHAADGYSSSDADLPSPIENQQSFEEIPAASEPEASAAGEVADDAFSPRTLRALLVSQLTGELLEVYRLHELYLERLAEFSPAARDACLAPSGQKWILTIRNQNSLERQIDRKLKQLRTLQSQDGWGGRLRRRFAGAPRRSNGSARPRRSGPRDLSAGSQSPNPEPRNPVSGSRTTNFRDVKLPKRSHDLYQNKRSHSKNEPKTNRQRTPNERSGTRNEASPKGDTRK